VKVDGEDEIRTVNIVGLRRSGEVSDTDIAALEVAAKTLFLRKKQPLALKMEALEAESNLNPRVKQIIDSIRRRDLGKHGRYLEGLRRG
jgi:acyl-[acyl carrier protein]--UDP-N-acetylglucosamine O-acyltransferase